MNESILNIQILIVADSGLVRLFANVHTQRALKCEPEYTRFSQGQPSCEI